MPIVKKEDIRGYYLDEQVVCVECIESKEEDGLKLESVITGQDVENNDEEILFCDRCLKKI
jgi:hypothetical protein